MGTGNIPRRRPMPIEIRSENGRAVWGNSPDARHLVRRKDGLERAVRCVGSRMRMILTTQRKDETAAKERTVANRSSISEVFAMPEGSRANRVVRRDCDGDEFGRRPACRRVTRG